MLEKANGAGVYIDVQAGRWSTADGRAGTTEPFSIDGQDPPPPTDPSPELDAAAATSPATTPPAAPPQPPTPPPAALASPVVPPAAVATVASCKYDLADLGDRMELTISLPEIVTSLSQLELNISISRVEIAVEGAEGLSLALPRAIDDAQASAKFKKKTHELRLEAPYA